jgi:hypothetical protein
MTAALLILTAALAADGPGAGAGADAAGLVRKLGAEGFDDRVAAYKALEALGPAALPAVRAALDDAAADPRVRARARALADELARRARTDRFGTPTLVKLDFPDATLGSVVDALNARHGFNLTLVTAPPMRQRGMVMMGAQNDPAQMAEARATKVSLVAPEPLPFWKAVDRIAAAAKLRYDLAPAGGAGNGKPEFPLITDRASHGPTSDYGPLRVQVSRVHRSAARDFTDDPESEPTAPAAVQLHPAALGVQTSGPGLTVSLAVVPEPGITVRLAGTWKIEEAVDDRGRSVRPEPKGPAPPPGAANVTMNYAGAPLAASAVFQVNLDPPADDATSLRRLRGAVPVTLTARRPDPHVFALKDRAAVGRSVQAGDSTVVLEDVSLDPDKDVSVTVSLTTSRKASVRRPGPTAAVSPDQPMQHFELVDAAGQRLAFFAASSSTSIGPDGQTHRLRLSVQPVSDPAAAPPANGQRLFGGRGLMTRRPLAAELRYYEFMTETAEVPFDLRDVPLP